MRKLLVLLTFVALLSPVTARAQDSTPAFKRGVNVLYYAADAHDPEAIQQLLDQLKAMNVGSILLNYPIYIDSWDGSAIREVNSPDETNPNGATPTPDELAAFINPAKAAGFDIMLRPLIDEQKLNQTGPEGAWRGEWEPADPEQFFNDLSGILTNAATTASRLGVPWLIIGSEMTKLETSEYDTYWESIIQSLRTTIGDSGVSLTYSENWDAGHEQGYPSWLSLLDAVSVDAYYPAEGVDANSAPAEVADAFTQWTQDLQKLQDVAPDKPFFITEIGVASEDSDPNVLAEPWTGPDELLPVDTQIQALQVQGACEYYRGLDATDGSRLVDGMYWWVTSVVRLSDPLNDVTFNFRDKPAGDQITSCFAH